MHKVPKTSAASSFSLWSMLVGQPNSESPGDVSIYQKNMLNFYYVSTMYIGSNYE